MERRLGSKSRGCDRGRFGRSIMKSSLSLRVSATQLRHAIMARTPPQVDLIKVADMPKKAGIQDWVSVRLL